MAEINITLPCPECGANHKYRVRIEERITLNRDLSENKTYQISEIKLEDF